MIIASSIFKNTAKHHAKYLLSDLDLKIENLDYFRQITFWIVSQKYVVPASRVNGNGVITNLQDNPSPLVKIQIIGGKVYLR